VAGPDEPEAVDRPPHIHRLADQSRVCTAQPDSPQRPLTNGTAQQQHCRIESPAALPPLCAVLTYEHCRSLWPSLCSTVRLPCRASAGPCRDHVLCAKSIVELLRAAPAPLDPLVRAYSTL
jgi:hypothetical protein